MIIDRTDINVEQRAPWVQLASEKARSNSSGFSGGSLVSTSVVSWSFLGPFYWCVLEVISQIAFAQW